MLKKILHRMIAKFEREAHYDAGYMHVMADRAPGLTWRFSRFVKLSHYGKKAPPRLLALARIAAIKSEDCGPCLQLAIDFGRQAGLDTETIRDAVQNPERLSGDSRLIFDFATAVAKNTEDAEALRERVQNRFGLDSLAELAVAIATARVYPAVKRGLGYAKTCNLMQFNFKKAS